MCRQSIPRVCKLPRPASNLPMGEKMLYYECMNKSSISEKLRAITQAIVDQFQPEQIILFGSYAWGTPNEDSDIDLLVIKESDEAQRKRARILIAFFSRANLLWIFSSIRRRNWNGPSTRTEIFSSRTSSSMGKFFFRDLIFLCGFCINQRNY